MLEYSLKIPWAFSLVLQFWKKMQVLQVLEIWSFPES